jgi:hypothetical protein
MKEEVMNNRKFRDGQIVQHKLTEDKLLIIHKSVLPMDRIAYTARTRDYQVREFEEVELEERD